MILNLNNFRNKLVKFVPVLLIAFFFLSDFILDEVNNILNHRSRILTTQNYFNEGRVIENFMVWDKISESTISLLFGTGELFNSQGKYGLYTGDHHQYSRPIHNDYARLLFGSGLIGLLFYLYFISSLFIFSFKSKNFYNDFTKSIYKYNIFLIIVVFLMGISSGFTDIFYRTVIFSLVGFTHNMLNHGYRKL